MKFGENDKFKIILIGAGGTGGYIAPHLYRIAYASGRDVRIIIADGDIVEKKNLIRQNFVSCDVGRNKAQVVAERYASAFGIKAEYIPDFIEDKKTLKMLTDNGYYYNSEGRKVILIGAVDNNRSRQLCHKIFNETRNIIYIDSGNGEYTGQVVCGIRKNGRTITKPVAGMYPDILQGDEKFPTELSCAERSVSAPQSIAANLFASTIVASILYQLIVCGDLSVRKTTFSSQTMNTKTLLSKRSGR
ncbi:MAG: hypothetical protein HFE51_09895 [Clostridia bacterium]|nr:hypothetical protein [Clostridia bacterium]MCI8979387.1 hypothetical protein [Clostridia bacterium]MCI9086714.1 hypothetical protein [Clostridia bacterium]NDO20317.1 hypothetical protein [Lachnospiraceae bacterium MD329]